MQHVQLFGRLVENQAYLFCACTRVSRLAGVHVLLVFVFPAWTHPELFFRVV